MQKNINKAALAIYIYLCKLKRFKINPSESALQIAQKARFSKDGINEDELRLIKAEADITLYFAKMRLHHKILTYVFGLYVKA
jgi:hypothetical protein